MSYPSSEVKDYSTLIDLVATAEADAAGATTTTAAAVATFHGLQWIVHMKY